MRSPSSPRLVLCLALFACGDDSGGGGTPDGPPGGGDGQANDGPANVDGTQAPDAAPIVCEPVAGTPELQLEMVQGGFQRPVFVTSPPGDTRLFVVEEEGTIDIVGGGTFLDIVSMVECCGEQGLLGLAFHPQFAANGRFFVYYIDLGSNIQIDEFTVSSSDPNLADVSSRRPVTNVPHSISVGNQGNHNGGMIAFGPDDFLYISTGDGGSQNDPDENGQNTGILLAKMLRIDVDGTGDGPFDNYAIPVDNPLGNEIWALGFRNPWRFSFDRMTNDIYVGDVGGGVFEEVDVIPTGMAGLNFGWDIYEGTDCHEEVVRPCVDPTTDDTAVEFPVHEISTGGNRAIIGGYVYRGCKMPDYHGTYFYGTLNGDVKSLEWASGSTTNVRDWPALEITAGSDRLSAFGEDYEGEIYLAALNEGVIYKIVPVP